MTTLQAPETPAKTETLADLCEQYGVAKLVLTTFDHQPVVFYRDDRPRAWNNAVPRTPSRPDRRPRPTGRAHLRRRPLHPLARIPKGHPRWRHPLPALIRRQRRRPT